MSEIDGILKGNASYVEGFDEAGLGAPPVKRVAIVACMDARLDVAAALGLAPGDAHVLRNAGGVVTEDMVRSVAISQAVLGTREVMVIQHTDCGMRKKSEAEIKAAVGDAAGTEPGFAMYALADLEADVRDAVSQLERSPYLTHTHAVRGFVYEVETGLVREVES